MLASSRVGSVRIGLVPPPSDPKESYQIGTLLPNGKVLVVDGGTGAGLVASAELYYPAMNTWSTAASPAMARLDHTATLLTNGKVLIAGGLGGAGVQASAELYDPATNTWSPAAGMSATRYGHTATLLSSGKVLVAGGSSGDSGLPVGTELYDPAANTWSSAGSLWLARYQHTATLLLNGEVLVAGGNDGTGGALADARRYEPSAPASVGGIAEQADVASLPSRTATSSNGVRYSEFTLAGVGLLFVTATGWYAVARRRR